MPLDDRAVNGSTSANMNGHSDSGVMVFSAALTRDLSTQRLAPVYVGVRRVRPSSRWVRHALSTTATTTNSNVVYKIISDDGVERRMTAQEKRHAKWQEKAQAKQRKWDAAHGSGQPPGATETTESMEPEPPHCETVLKESDHDDRYFWACVPRHGGTAWNPAHVADELADLRGERDGVPPVMLSPALARLVTLGNHSAIGTPFVAIPDDDLAHLWALALATHMQVAEAVRQGETDWRPMPYRLVPEVWHRLRPASTKVESVVPISTPGQPGNEPETCNDSMESTLAFAHCSIRPSLQTTTRRLEHEAAIVELLHRDTNLHISCGAKFGCDYLLYDGPRAERHAFAGLRIVPSPTNEKFPLPTAYDLTGYVRCLNTAGKLALIATVVRDTVDGPHPPRLRVLFVDLALVKVAATTSKRPRKTMEQRVKNLAKTTKATPQQRSSETK